MQLSLTTWRLLKKKYFLQSCSSPTHPSTVLMWSVPDAFSLCAHAHSQTPANHHGQRKNRKQRKRTEVWCSAVVRISCLLSLYCAQLDLTFWVRRDVLLLSGLTEDGWVSFSLFSPVGFQETQDHQQDFPHKLLTATRTKIRMVPLNPPAHQWPIMVVFVAFFLEVFHLV